MVTALTKAKQSGTMNGQRRQRDTRMLFQRIERHKKKKKASFRLPRG